MRRGGGGGAQIPDGPAAAAAPHSLLFVLPLLKAPGGVALPSLSFSWFSQSMFSDLQREGDGTRRQPAATRTPAEAHGSRSTRQQKHTPAASTGQRCVRLFWCFHDQFFIAIIFFFFFFSMLH